MKRMKPGLLAAALLAAWSAPAGAGPWPQPLGTVYAKVSFSYLEATSLATSDGKRIDIPSYRRQEVSLYVQAPLSARWTAIAAVPLYQRSEIDEFGHAEGVGDVAVGVQALFASRGVWRFAGRLTLQAPSGDETKGQRVLPTGSGVWEGEAVLALGGTFLGGRGYGFVEAGHRARGAGFADALVYRTEVGVRVRQRWLLAGRVWGLDPYSPRRPPIGAPAGLGDGVSYLALGPSATLEVGKGWAVQTEVDFADEARGIALGPTVRLAAIRSR